MKGKKLLFVLLCVFIGASLACSYSITKNDENDSSEMSKKNGIKLPHYGAYFIDGNDYAEIQENQGAPSSNSNSNDFLHTKQQPVISLWYPNVNVDYLEIRSLSPSSSEKFHVTPNPKDKEILDIQPAAPLDSGLYCLILGNPIASPNDIPYWCFFVEDQYTINGSDTGQATQKPNLPITPVPTPTPSSEYIYIPYDEIPSEPGYTIMAMAWRPDSSMVAIVYDYLNTGLTPVSPSASHLYFYDSSTGELINKMDDLHEPTVKDLVWSPDGDEIATLDIQGRLIVRNYETNAVVVDYDLQLYNWILDWSDKGNYLAVGSLLGVVIFETNDWKEIHRLEVYDSTARPFLDFIPHLEISPSGERIAIIKLHKELTMWDIKTGEMINKREGNFQDFTWNPKSDTLAATVLKKGNGGPDYDTVYYDENLESGWKLSFTGPISISWNPTNDNYLSVGAFDETSESAQIYDLTTLKPVMNFNQYERIYSLIWSPDGSKLVGRGETGIYIFPIDNLLP